MLTKSNSRRAAVHHLTTAAYLAKRGVPSDVIHRWASQFGRLAKRRYMELNGTEPGQLPQLINGRARKVFAYRDADVPMLDEVWNEFRGRLRGRGLL